MTLRRSPKRRLRRIELLEPRLMLHGGSDGPHDHAPDYDPTTPFHIHAQLEIFVNSSEVTIPEGVGDTVGIHTHDDSGELHLHPNLTNPGSQTDFITLGDFFEVWRTDPDAEDRNLDAVLSATNLMGNTVDAAHSLQMFVNGIGVTDFEDYRIHDGDVILLVYGSNPIITINTNVGPIVMELFADPVTDPALLRADESGPVDVSGTVDNFLGYVNRGDYDDMFFHRSQTDFVIQGGGFTTATGNVADTDQIGAVSKGPTILNEPGVSNLRTIVAMARQGGKVNSATNEFFFNLSDDNTFLDDIDEGFTGFGRVLDMTTIDLIEELATEPVLTTNVFTAGLEGSFEVPSVTTDAIGSAALEFDPTTETFDLEVFIEGISQAELTESHIHVGSFGVNGAEIFDLGDGSLWIEEPGGLRRQIVAATFPSANVQDLLDGDTYLNVHTTDHSAGEIRGQLFRRTFSDPGTGFPPVTDDAGSVSIESESQFVFVESIVGQGTIRGTIFNDVDLDGERDENDAGIPDVTVYLDTNNNSQLDDDETSTITAEDGSYFFHVKNGTHVIRQIVRPGFAQTSPLGPDSLTVPIEIAGIGTDINFGNDGFSDLLNSLAGIAYVDENNNAVRDSNEELLAGVTITLSGTDDVGVQVNRTRVTGGDGSYNFRNLAPGEYNLDQTQPEFLIDGLDTIGSQGGDASVNDRFTIQLLEGTEGVENNFGERGRSAAYVLLSDFFSTREDLPNFANRFDDTILAATDLNDGHLWSSLGADWSGFTSAEVRVSPDETTVTLTVVDIVQTEFTATLGLNDPRVTVLGRIDDTLLIRLNGTSSDFPLVPT